MIRSDGMRYCEKCKVYKTPDDYWVGTGSQVRGHICANCCGRKSRLEVLSL